MQSQRTPPLTCGHLCTSADKRERAGLGAALLTMLPGERALVRVDSSRAYGEQGNFSFPAVAPHAALLYDVHLLAVQRAQEETPVKVCDEHGADDSRMGEVTHVQSTDSDMHH